MYGQDILKETVNGKTGRTRNVTGAKSAIEIEGLDELLAAFAALDEDAILKLGEPSVRAAEIVLAKAKAKTHDVTGDLDRALKVKKPGRAKGHATQIFARVTFDKKGAHGVPLELGHDIVIRTTKKNGKSKKTTVGAVTERPFMRPAADESKEQVADILTDAMNKIIDEVWGGK